MPTLKEKINAMFSGFENSFRIISLCVAAIVGLWISSRYISDDEQNPPFHEISWSPKEVIQTIINDSRNKVGELSEKFISTQNEVATKTAYWRNKTDTGAAAKEKVQEEVDKFKKRIGLTADSFQKKQIEALNTIQDWLNSKSDTAIRAEVFKNSTLYINTRDFSIDDYISKIDKDSNKTLSRPLRVTYVRPELAGGQITGDIFLHVKKYPATERFFNKYPGFALWSLLLIIQAIFYCVLIAAFLFHFLTASENALYKKHLDYKAGRILLLLVCVISLLLIVFFTLLNDKKGQLVSGNIFMSKLHDIFFTVNMVGHIAASFCLVGMINCVIYMSRLKKLLAIDAEKKLPADVNAPNDDSKKLTPENIELLRKDIKRRFNLYFILTAIILSLAIFTSGIFFSSMNNMEFIKQVTKDQGFSTVNTEMVYIYAVLYSFFLVLIYLPVRYMLNSLDKEIPSAATPNVTDPQNQNDEKNKSFFSKLSTNLFGLKDVAIAASPILASLLQKLVDALFS